MTLQELQKQVMELPVSDRWVLLKLLIEVLQPEASENLQAPKPDNDLGWSPGFFERTAGAWQGEPLERGDQGECDRSLLLQWLMESVEAAIDSTSDRTKATESAAVDNEHSLSQFYGCIDDETFIRHPQPEQLEREQLL